MEKTVYPSFFANMFLRYLSYFSSFFVVVPFLICFIRRKLLFDEVRPIFYLISLTFAVEIINLVTVLNQINNLFVLHVFTVFEFILLSFFYKQFFDTFIKSRIYIFLISFFLLVACYDAFLLNGFNTMNNLAASVEFIILIIYALLSFFLILKNLVYENLLQTPFFWINTAVLIYFSGNLFLFLFTTYLQKYDIPDYGSLYAIHSVLNIVYYILISIGFWKVQTK